MDDPQAPAQPADDQQAQAQAAVSDLMQADTNQLYEILGVRAKAVEQDPAAARSFSPDVTYNPANMGALDDVRAFGKDFFSRMESEAYGLVCGVDDANAGDRQNLMNALNLGSKEAVAGVLTTLLVTSLGIAPALAPVAAALIVRLFFKPAYGAMCDAWKQHLPAAPPATPAG